MRALIAVFLGGAAGSALRLLTDDALSRPDTAFPWSTLLINLAGSFLLGLFVSRLWPAIPGWLRAALGPGLLGGFTTFSAVMVSLVTMTGGGGGALAIVYLAASVVLGIGAAALGLRVGRRANAVPTIEVNE